MEKAHERGKLNIVIEPLQANVSDVSHVQIHTETGIKEDIQKQAIGKVMQQVRNMNKTKKEIRHEIYIKLFKKMLKGNLGRRIDKKVIFDIEEIEKAIKYHEYARGKEWK